MENRFMQSKIENKPGCIIRNKLSMMNIVHNSSYGPLKFYSGPYLRPTEMHYSIKSF